MFPHINERNGKRKQSKKVSLGIPIEFLTCWNIKVVTKLITTYSEYFCGLLVQILFYETLFIVDSFPLVCILIKTVEITMSK